MAEEINEYYPGFNVKIERESTIALENKTVDAILYALTLAREFQISALTDYNNQPRKRVGPTAINIPHPIHQKDLEISSVIVYNLEKLIEDIKNAKKK